MGDGLERRGLTARGRVGIDGLTRAERHALSDVLGRPVTADEVRIDLAELDVRLAGRTGDDLVTLVGRLLGRPLVDRAERRRAAARRRDEPFDAARAWLAQHASSYETAAPWVAVWLQGLRRDGVLTAQTDGVAVLRSALEVLDHCSLLPADLVDGCSLSSLTGSPVGGAGPLMARTDLAARVTGTAHGLDDDTRLAQVVLRAAAARAGSALPRDAAARRRLWESMGVVTDRVSTTCLTWNLVASEGPALAAAPLASSLRHLTWWDLDRGIAWLARDSVLVCENPRTLEAVAELEVADLAVVCTMGRANLVVRAVLSRLSDAGATLRYHGDFDWAGIALANACLRDFGAEPWLMSVADYEQGLGSEPLKGPATEADWDPELGAAMRARGVAVHEEALIDEVLRRLDELK